ncbi:MAG: hypothetical protein QXT26_08845, partial [Thermoproteota archaeon]
MKYGRMFVLLLAVMLMLSTLLIAVPVARGEGDTVAQAAAETKEVAECDGEDPIHIYYQGNKISNPPEPIVWTGPCTAESFTFTVVVQWDSLPDPKKVNWCSVQMVEKSSFGITFVPSSTTLYNPSPNSITVEVTVLVAGLLPGTYEANIYTDVTDQGPEKTPKVAGTNGYFQFVKESCVPPAKYYLVVQTDPSGIVEIPGSGTYENCTYVELTAPEFVPSEEGENGFRYRFDYWDVDGKVVEGNPITVHMDANHVATAHYTPEYYLTVISPYGTVGGAGWYSNGSTAYATLDTGMVDHGNGTRRVFTHWSEDASGTNYAQSNPITMNESKTAIANWKTQYRLFVSISPDNLGIGNITISPTGDDPAGTETGQATSIDSCTWVNLTAPNKIYVSAYQYYPFSQWTIDSETNSSLSIMVHMDSPKNITAEYGLLAAETYTITLTFKVNGVGKDYTGIILTVQTKINGEIHNYAYTLANISSAVFDLPVGANVTFTWYSPLSVVSGTTGRITKQYVWYKTT